MRTVVLVLGDLGRSPRMQYHAMSLADMKRSTVELVGYAGAACRPEIVVDDRVTIHHLHNFNINIPRAMFIVWAPIKVALQILQLFWLLLIRLRRFDSVLVQNPPGLPALIVVRLVCWIVSSRFIIDWHNFGYTLLAHKFGGRESHPFVQLAYWYERLVGWLADDNICVTRAMSNFLKEEWSITARVMHDQPPPHFRPLDWKDRHELFGRLENEKDGCLQSVAPWMTALTEKDEEERWTGLKKERTFSVNSYEEREVRDAPEVTSFCYWNERGVLVGRRRRPALVVSSTSWTPDEDFNVLLEAAKLLDEIIAKNLKMPPVVIVITGRGPMLDEFKEKLRNTTLKYVKILTAWLKIEDYPKLLGSADIGVSLHTSSSGLDLPMKVVDMFGCSLPVCAYDFKCLGELVRHGVNGYVFTSSEELARRLQEMLQGFPTNTRTLNQMRACIEKKRTRWSETWNTVVKPIFQEIDKASSTFSLARLFRLITYAIIAVVAMCAAGFGRFFGGFLALL